LLTGSALRPGVTAAIQTFGDRIKLRPHLHFLVTEGGVDAAGVFHEIPRIDDLRLAEIFARKVLVMLVRKELLSPEWAERILYYGLYANAHIHRSSEADVCDGEAPDVPCL